MIRKLTYAEVGFAIPSIRKPSFESREGPDLKSKNQQKKWLNNEHPDNRFLGFGTQKACKMGSQNHPKINENLLSVPTARPPAASKVLQGAIRIPERIKT